MANNAVASHKSSSTTIRARRWVNTQIGSFVLGSEHNIFAICLVRRAIPDSLNNLIWRICWDISIDTGLVLNVRIMPDWIKLRQKGLGVVRWVFISIWPTLHISPLPHPALVLIPRAPSMFDITTTQFSSVAYLRINNNLLEFDGAAQDV
jgi:hypothetical protein